MIPPTQIKVLKSVLVSVDPGGPRWRRRVGGGGSQGHVEIGRYGGNVGPRECRLTVPLQRLRAVWEIPAGGILERSGNWRSGLAKKQPPASAMPARGHSATIREERGRRCPLA